MTTLLPRTPVLAAVLGTALLLPRPQALPAQILGRVTDEVSELPVPTAGVAFLDEQGNVLGQAVTDAQGLFVSPVLGTGDYFLQVVALGYVATPTAPVNYAGERIFLEIGLSPAPIVTDGLLVSVESRVAFLEMGGFYSRMSAGFGDFLGPDEIRARKAVRSSHLMRVMPSVVLWEEREPVFARTLGTRPEEGLCFPDIYLDGQPLRTVNSLTDRWDPMRFDVVVPPPDQISAIEAYPGGATIPPQWRRGSAGCGVIVVWSRRY
ncbi:MAG: carboxypeptidase-like regulatory domain-containing protein [Longimicrobiales bacterium]|nr:carboxypeptidase-like regulatory domain-containing protein [Longimicrobiales bacterium]